jgi:hypothetical protein
MNKKSIAVIVAALFLGVFFSGCQSVYQYWPFQRSSNKPKAYTINIGLDDMLAGMSLQVEVIGTNPTDLSKWESLSVSQYWQPGNVQRRDANKVTYDFGRGKPATVSLPLSDPKWNQWLDGGATHLVILADLPTLAVDQPGNADSRRLVLPLGKDHWKESTIDILVQESGVRLQTKENTQKK